MSDETISEKAERLARSLNPFDPSTEVRAHMLRRAGAHFEQALPAVAEQLAALPPERRTEEECRRILANMVAPLLDELELIEAAIKADRGGDHG